MKGTVYVYRAGKVVPKDTAGPRDNAGKRVHVISDTMDHMFHPCDGRHYDSKAKFRAVTKAHGGIEVGHERQHQRRPEPDRTIKVDIARAIAELGG
jgi:hypothetical protein